MNEREDGYFIPCKKFKSSHEKIEDIACGGHKSKAEVEAGNYFLGPIIKKYVKAPVTQCLARKKGTDDYYLMKILLLDDSDFSDKCTFVRRTVFHNEYSFLTLLKGHPGVIQISDFFKDCIFKDNSDKSNINKLKRICMVLECLIPHGPHNAELILLNHYLKEDKLSETEALYIFYNLLLVLEDLHKKNIVHRDLKLTNIILNRKTLKVKLINFYYAKLLISSNEVQYDHYRTSSYSSPDVLSGQPVLPKTCDMWSAGVILYAMLKGCMPFGLNNTCISDGTKDLLRNILRKIPQLRLKASEAVDMVSTLLALQCTSQNPSLFAQSKCSDQVVPECPDFDSKTQLEYSTAVKRKSSSIVFETSREFELNKDYIKQKVQKNAKDDIFELSSSTSTNQKPQQDSLLNRKEVKCAMLRLGATTVNSINALSFNYSKKNSCQS